TVHVQQNTANVGISGAGRRIRVPRKRRSARASARFVYGLIGTCRAIIDGLGLPRDNPVFDVNVPGTRAGAIDAVRRTHHFLMTPPIAVEGVTGASADLEDCAAIGRNRLVRCEEPSSFD